MINKNNEMYTYTENAGGAALASRLRRLSERLDREVSQFYDGFDVTFEQRWFGMLNLIDRFGPVSVGEVAAALVISHASVSQTRDSLHKSGLVEETADPNDRRRRTLRLTAKGADLVKKLKPVWDALSASAMELNAEAGDLVAAITRLEQALERRSVAQRAEAYL